jgi:alpha-L-fucosidase
MSQWSRRHFGQRFNAEELGDRGGILLAAAVVAALVLEAAPPQASPKRYEATRQSLASRPTPQWFNQAKFGIFIVWGPYSVPAFAPKGRYAEWYWHRVMDARKTNDLTDEFLKFHDRVYGPQFRYEDFVPLFHSEMFNPDQWIDLIVRSGAKYVVHSAKYHDAFCLWPSEEADLSWGRPCNSVTAGPRRDLVGELERAGRARGLKMGLYYSLYEWYNPLYLSDFARYRDPGQPDF